MQTGVSLKTKSNPKGIFTELELFEMLATLVRMYILFSTRTLMF